MLERSAVSEMFWIAQRNTNKIGKGLITWG